jgi:hypothetical protein
VTHGFTLAVRDTCKKKRYSFVSFIWRQRLGALVITVWVVVAAWEIYIIEYV